MKTLAMKALILGTALGLASSVALADFGNLVDQQVYFNGGQKMVICTYQGLNGSWTETHMGYNACPSTSNR